MGEDKNIAADWVGLAVGPEPNPSGPLAELLGVDRTGDGFWQEADYKWRPVETMREGVLVCGAGRAPMRADEAAAEGRAAAGRALALLDQNLVRASLQTAKVRASLCSLCRACVQACPFAARWVDQDAGCVQVDPTLCQGCGMCASVCPNQATRIGQFEGEAMIEALETVLME
jgi:heterodisulfide reductase subunit A